MPAIFMPRRDGGDGGGAPPGSVSSAWTNGRAPSGGGTGTLGVDVDADGVSRLHVSPGRASAGGGLASSDGGWLMAEG